MITDIDRQFIDRAKQLAHRGWLDNGLKPIHGEFGDGLNTGCALTAIACQNAERRKRSLGFIDRQSVLQLRAIAEELGIPDAEKFAEEVTAYIPWGFDAAGTPCFHAGNIGYIIGRELRQELLDAPVERCATTATIAATEGSTGRECRQG